MAMVRDICTLLTTDAGKILAGFQVPPDHKSALEDYFRELDYTWWDETDNIVYKRFMTKNMG